MDLRCRFVVVVMDKCERKEERYYTKKYYRRKEISLFCLMALERSSTSSVLEDRMFLSVDNENIGSDKYK